MLWRGGKKKVENNEKWPDFVKMAKHEFR